MDYKLHDLIDLSLFQSLQENLNRIHPFPSAILDIEGNILTATAWQDICTQFHRANPDSARECFKSDQHILNHIDEANPAYSYTCSLGLNDNAIPLIINGKHLANFFTGQFFRTPPDINFFKKNAKKYGYDEEKYLEALAKVPILTPTQYNDFITFINIFSKTLIESAEKKLKEIENQKTIQETEKALFEKEANVIAILEASFSIIILLDAEGTILENNTAHASRFGKSREEMIGKCLWDFLPKDIAAQRLKKIIKVINTGVPEEGEELRDDRWTHFVIYPVVGNNGIIDKVSVYAHDITEQKKNNLELITNQEKYKNLVNGLLEGLVIIGFDGKILFLNPAVLRIFGYEADDLQSLLNNSFTAYLHHDSIEAAMLDLEKVYQGQGLLVDYKIIKKDGSLGWIRSRGVKIEFEKKEADLVLFHDITQQKNTEEALRKEMKQLEILNSHMVDREIRMVELKKEINELLSSQGKPKKY